MMDDTHRPPFRWAACVPLHSRAGVRDGEHFDATDCYTTQETVVGKVLAILDKALR